MNLIIIGDDTDKIAMTIWKANTNYTVLNNNPCLWNKQFIKYIENKNVIVSTTAEQFVYKNINDVLDYFISYDFIPILIASSKDSIETNMYTALSDDIPSAVLYVGNEKTKDYDKLIKISQDYLLGKGIIQNDNKTLRTPRKRKTKTTRK